MPHPPSMVLEARGVTKRYGATTALADVSVGVAEGECLALVGESGSGKTTLLRAFNRMVEADSGVVLVRGRDVAEVDAVGLRRSIGYVQQSGGLLPHWSVERNAGLVPWMTGDRTAVSKGRAALDRVGLPADTFGARWPRELSGGQRQRAALARALAGDPGILLLDEPFGALDAITRVDVQRTFDRLRRDLGLTVVLVTHDLRQAFLLADRIAVMRAGGIEQIDDPDTLRRAPATDYVRELLAKAGTA